MDVHRARSTAAETPFARRRERERALAEVRGRRVRWIEGGVPDTEETRLVFEALTERGLTTYEEVVRYVADTLYWRDLLRGGWATDIRLVRPIYFREARETLERLAGTLVTIQ